MCKCKIQALLQEPLHPHNQGNGERNTVPAIYHFLFIPCTFASVVFTTASIQLRRKYFACFVLHYFLIRCWCLHSPNIRRYSFSLKIQPLSLTAKYERRTNDYKRSYRMGVMSKDLQKMSNTIKTHRNMLDSYKSFSISDDTDDATDDSEHRHPENIVEAFPMGEVVEVVIPGIGMCERPLCRSWPPWE